MKSNAYYKDLKRFPSKKGRAFHHAHYSHIGKRSSIYWVDGMYLPRWYHIGLIHCILGGSKRAGNQRFGKFPNIFQRVAMWIARFVFLVF